MIALVNLALYFRRRYYGERDSSAKSATEPAMAPAGS
jgi:hypothetical protein